METPGVANRTAEKVLSFQAKVLVLLLLFDLWRRERIRSTLFASSECYLDGNRAVFRSLGGAPTAS